MKKSVYCVLLGCLTVAILLTIVSCTSKWAGESITDPTQSTPEIFEEITPDADTPGLIAPEDTAPEQIPEETTPPRQTTVGQTTEVPQMSTETTTQKLPEDTKPQESTTQEEITAPAETTTKEETLPEETTPPTEETTTPEETVHPTVTNISAYDNDHDGVRDSFCFSPKFPKRFESADAIHFSAGDYVKTSGMGTGSVTEGDNFQYWYCREGKKSYLVYQIEVTEAGTYELAIYQRMKDTEERGAKLTVNDGTQVLQISYQFATQAELLSVCNNENAMSSFMFGIVLELKEGINTLKIEAAGATESNQYFRDFYLIKISD